jgi:uncharacterized protein
MRTSSGRFACFAAFTAILVMMLAGRPFAGQTGPEKKAEHCFLWKVSSKTATVYLLGSMHVVNAGFFPLPKEMEDAFANSKVLVVEVNTEKLDQAKLQELVQQRGLYPAGQKLSTSVSQKTMDAVRQYSAKMGMDEASIESLRPWLLGVLVSVTEVQAQGLDADGIDKHFIKKASADNKPVRELETPETQVELLAGFTPELQEKMLAKALADVDRIKGEVEKVTAAWKAGDAKAMEEVMLTNPVKRFPEAKAVLEKVFDERNVKMAEKIEKMLKGTESCFVVVGAGHLVGQKGIIKLLEDKKYSVEQVKRAAK